MPFGGEVDDELVDVVLRPDVDAARDVEQEQHVGFGEQPSPDQDFLLIAPRQRSDRLQSGVTGLDLESLGHVRDERDLSPTPHHSGLADLVEHGEREIVFHRHRQHQSLGLPVLRDERDRKASLDRVRRASKLRPLAADRDLPSRELPRPEEREEQLGLPLAGEAADAEYLATFEVEGDAAEDVALQSVGAQRNLALGVWERRPVRIHAIDRSAGHESDGLVLGEPVLRRNVLAVSQDRDSIGERADLSPAMRGEEHASPVVTEAADKPEQPLDLVLVRAPRSARRAGGCAVRA